MYAELLISSTLIHWLSLCISLRKARCIIHFKSCLNTLNSNNIQKTKQNSSQVHPVTSAHPRHCSVSWTLQTSNQLKLWMPGSLFLRAWEETDSKIKKKIITSPSCHKHTPTPLFCLLKTADIKSVKVVNAWIFVSENMKWDRLKKKKKKKHKKSLTRPQQAGTATNSFFLWQSLGRKFPWQKQIYMTQSFYECQLVCDTWNLRLLS